MRQIAEIPEAPSPNKEQFGTSHNCSLGSPNTSTINLTEDLVTGLRSDYKLRSRFKKETRIHQKAFHTLEKALIRHPDYRKRYVPRAALDVFQQWQFICLKRGITVRGRLDLDGAIAWVISHKAELSFQTFLNQHQRGLNYATERTGN